MRSQASSNGVSRNAEATARPAPARRAQDSAHAALRIANIRGVPGTAGVLVRHAAGAWLLLSSYHVVFGGGSAVGDRVWAVPDEDKVDGGALEAVVIGRARAGRLGCVTFAGEVYFVDCALVELASVATLPPWVQAAVANTPRPAEVTAAVPGTRVRKNGVATGTTEGVVVDVAYPDRPFIEGRTRPAPQQLLVDSREPELNFSAPGDSGAALLDERGRLLGLLWGSNTNGQGIACPVEPVLDCLGVTLL